jgi:hypothetical protein
MLLGERISGAVVCNDQLVAGPVEIGQVVLSSSTTFRQGGAELLGALESAAGGTAIAA